MDQDLHLKTLGIEPLKSDEFHGMPEHELIVLEQSLGVRFPASYRAFLMAYGASGFKHGISYHPAIPLPAYLSPEGIGDISFFYGPKSDRYETYSLAEMIRALAERMPENIIPIGGETGGNEICLGIRGPETGKVYYWDHENEWDEEDYLERGLPVPPDMKFQNVHRIADSFEDFIARLYIADEADE